MSLFTSIALSAAWLTTVAVTQVQSPNQLPQYGTVAIHLAPKEPPFLGCDEQPARLRCFLNLRGLVSRAYSIRYEFVLQGPNWSEDKIWELEASVDPGDVDRVRALSPDQRSSMMQRILTDRFGLTVHQEMRVQPVYDLIIAKGGHKLRPMESATDADRKGLPSDSPKTDFFTISNGSARGVGETMSEIADQLSGALGSGLIDRPILDKTGLAGRWNFTLTDTPHNEQAPSPFTVLQEQLGLKLVAVKEPVPVLVITRSQIPSAN